eukprot:gnl/MRDRNA2_/MRDRNA2_92792_c0_seq1.p1 gnl/MRDRNA2_/MRDRNA2_92792_c0~~gnl/MRDRNA2_/MRDRNA2_92792_c0_seq1.p1  ORF type:complete len:163 (+),score=48.70 gnl/MRDRNA2_/MRDRNA2_92792_c0_seq1:126-614(+)
MAPKKKKEHEASSNTKSAAKKHSSLSKCLLIGIAIALALIGILIALERTYQASKVQVDPKGRPVPTQDSVKAYIAKLRQQVITMKKNIVTGEKELDALHQKHWQYEQDAKKKGVEGLKAKEDAANMVETIQAKAREHDKSKETVRSLEERLDQIEAESGLGR